MFRLFYLTFSGSFRGTEEQMHHVHESPKIMTIPLMILAVLSVIGGLINIPSVFGGHESLNTFLSLSVHSPYVKENEQLVTHSTEIILMVIAVLGAVAMILFAWTKFVKSAAVPVGDEESRPALANLLYKKYYIDEIYHTIFEKPVLFLSKVFHQIDIYLIDRGVNSFGGVALWVGGRVRLLQQGTIGFYLVFIVLSIAAFLVFTLMI
jgi:NADH-quinone oxidoreductase subunit L